VTAGVVGLLVGDLRVEAPGGGAVPVVLARLDKDAVARPYFLDGSPSRWHRPIPSVTKIVWPAGWVCHAVRAPGAKWTTPPMIRDGGDGVLTTSM
jgi:hypothetical protein